MLFSSQNQVQQLASNAILAGTSTNAIVWREQISLFYTGAATGSTQDSHGIWIATSQDGELWAGPRSIQDQLALVGGPPMSVMSGTSASAAFSDTDSQLYLFYTDAARNGISYTTSDQGLSWSVVRSVADSIKQQFPNDTQMEVMDETSPSAVFWNGRLYLFYTGAGGDGIWYTTSSDGSNWSAVQSITRLVEQQFPGSKPSPVMNKTSPNAIAWNNQLCLFYTGPNYGIQYTLTTDGRLWNKVQSIQEKVSGMDVQASSSASALVFLNTLYVFYTGAGRDGLWYTTTREGSEWSDATPVDKNSGIQRGASGTNPWAVVYEGLLFVFWYGAAPSTQGLWFYRTIVEVDTSLVFLNGRASWNWATSTSTNLPFVGPLKLREVGPQDEFVFKLNPSVRGVFTTIDLTLNASNGSHGITQTAFVPSGFQSTLRLILADASIDVAVTGSNGTFTLAFSNDNKIDKGYYVSTIIKVLVNNVEYTSPDPQIVLRPSTPITEPQPSLKERR